MEKIISRVLILLSIVSLVAGNLISFGGKVSYAGDLELIGNDEGIEIIPESEKLLDLSNLGPGDSREASITIINNYPAPFELFMRTERAGEAPSADQADLFEQLHLSVYLGDEEIYSGSMKDFASTDTRLGEFESEDREILRASVYLPGPETGNEFQDSQVEVRWIFTALSEDLEEDFLDIEDPGEDDFLDIEDPGEEDFLDAEDPGDEKPKLPKTGEVVPMAFYGIGILLLGLGVAIGRKKRKSIN